MQSLHFQQSTGTMPVTMINRFQEEPEFTHQQIRTAVRAWAAAIDNQDVVAAMIVEEYQLNGGGLEFPVEINRQRQKIFRWLDGDTSYACGKIRELTPAIMNVLPLEFRIRLVPQEDTLSRVAAAMKECAEAKQAVLMKAPEHQKLKEVSEGIASLFHLMPEQVGPLMTMVTSMLGVI
ncbi:toxin YdaT domain-containing protein [Atlantibacter hermannii]|uniref:toxin YdaT domain-containing protein n=1 Tax=Atlantibacter hermannii TaxID=565 RepID=UPI0028A67ED8|nr:toxin YdaT domain-containing protein [Atlantibacter hermannii]